MTTEECRERYPQLTDAEFDRLSAFKKQHFRYFESLLAAMTAGVVKRRYIPDLEMNLGDECYTDHETIVLGLNQPLADGEEELFELESYILGHEVQHILSTSTKAWRWGIMQGITVIIDGFRREYGYRLTPMKDEAAMAAVLGAMFRDGHPVPALDRIAMAVHHVVNAVEDGRIERHRTGRYPGFGRCVRYYRGKQWLRNEVKEYDLSRITDGERAGIYMNEILSLATVHRFSKGFWKYYAGTEIENFVSGMIPIISHGVYATSCKQAMSCCIELIRMLTPTLVKAYSGDPALKFLTVLLAKILNMKGTEGFSERSESTEEKADANGEVFRGVLEEPALDGDGNVTGETKPGSAGQIGEKQGEKENAEQPDNGAQNDSKGNMMSGDSGQTAASAGELNSSAGHRRPSEAGDAPKEHKGNRGAGGSRSAEPDAEFEKNVEAARAAAAASAADTMEAGSGNTADSSLVHDGYTEISGCVPGTYRASDSASVRNIPFGEFFRGYDVDIPLPAVIRMQAEELRQQVAEKFRIRRTGFIRNKTSGDIDGRNLWKLAVNETDAFCSRKTPETFSGCCYILQDNSGSMGSGRNSKRMFACEATARIEYAFKCYMPLKIVAFDEWNTVIHDVVKDWTESFDNSCSMSFYAHGRSGMNNEDSEDIFIAADELMARPERNKILIVISDGAPADREAVRTAVDEARAMGIYVVGIYIEEHVSADARAEYEAMYGTNIVFTDTDHIGEGLCNVMESWLFNA